MRRSREDDGRLGVELTVKYLWIISSTVAPVITSRDRLVYCSFITVFALHLSKQIPRWGQANRGRARPSAARLPLALSDVVDVKLHVLFDGADDGLDVLLRGGAHDGADLIQDRGQELMSILKAAAGDG